MEQVLYNTTQKNLKNKTGSLFWDNSPDASIWDGVKLPVLIVEEYPTWILVEVLPHYNSNNSFDISQPYRIGINKQSALHGSYKLLIDVKDGIL